MKIKSLIMVGLLLSASSVIAADKKSNRELTSDVKQLQKQVQKINRLVGNQVLLELSQQMNDLQSEVSALRGEVEEQTHAIDGLKKRQRELYLDTDRRLRELELTGGARAPMKSALITTAKPQAPSLKKPSTAAKKNAIKKPTSAKKVAVKSPVNKSERAAYQAAFDLLKEGRYQKAIVSFHAFLKRYPNGSYADNAQYWLGEANYVIRKFDQALLEFDKVVTVYSASSKVPDALLKMGYTYFELQQMDEAKVTLETLIKRFPNSTVARLAEKRLTRMSKKSQ
ncbi:MAG: tol-pal system protein YbgF [Gammaproteobacteria bacterium]|nr:tol-pal system protein YbgF [Gammaproteobacteria bacterium]